MKIINKLNIILAVVSGILLTSCVENNDYTVPTIIGDEDNANLNAILDSIATKDNWNLVSISDVKAKFNSGDAPLLIETNDVVKGYVVSSDQTGNFFREFYIQDAPENPTAGIKVIINLTNNYNRFNFGREIYISLKDLYLGETNTGDGVTTIAGRIKQTDINEVDVISENSFPKHIFRSPNTETIVPKNIALSELNSSPTGTYVRINNAFFPDNLVGEPIVDPSEDFDTQRTVMACDGFNFSEGLIETSSFASFASSKLPANGGYIEAVVGKDFRGDNTVLLLNNFSDIVFNDTKCEPLNPADFTEAINEDFESTSSAINIAGWTNFAQEGTRLFFSYFDTDSDSRAARIGSFRSGDTSSVSWLITPVIDLDSTDIEFFSFQSSNSFSDDSELELLISTDWDGNTDNIATATWESLPANIVSDGEFFRNWVDSGSIELSDYSGNAYIAFKYTGSTTASEDGTFEIDNIKLLVK